MLAHKYRYRILKPLENNRSPSERQIPGDLGIDMSKVNGWTQVLTEKGLVNVSSFQRSKDKHCDLYLLTPKVTRKEAGVALRALKTKPNEHGAFQEESSESILEASKLAGSDWAQHES